MINGCNASQIPIFPVNQGAVAVERQDTVVGQPKHGFTLEKRVPREILEELIEGKERKPFEGSILAQKE